MDTGFEAGPCSLGVLIQLRRVISPAVWRQPWVPMATSWAPRRSGLDPRSGLGPLKPHGLEPGSSFPSHVPSKLSSSLLFPAQLCHPESSGPLTQAFGKAPAGLGFPGASFLPTSSYLPFQLLPTGGRVQRQPQTGESRDGPCTAEDSPTSPPSGGSGPRHVNSQGCCEQRAWHARGCAVRKYGSLNCDGRHPGGGDATGNVS